MLYRVDTESGPVRDMLGVRLISRWAIARRIAMEAHERTQETVTITRIGRAGHLSHALTIPRTGA
jgi:hypothetical protein